MASPTVTSPERSLRGDPRRLGDRVFRGLSTGSGLLVLVVIVLIAVFLVQQAIPALRADSSSFFPKTGGLLSGVHSLVVKIGRAHV